MLLHSIAERITRDTEEASGAALVATRLHKRLVKPNLLDGETRQVEGTGRASQWAWADLSCGARGQALSQTPFRPSLPSARRPRAPGELPSQLVVP